MPEAGVILSDTSCLIVLQKIGELTLLQTKKEILRIPPCGRGFVS
mgnify:CR=1 FL=1